METLGGVKKIAVEACLKYTDAVEEIRQLRARNEDLEAGTCGKHVDFWGKDGCPLCKVEALEAEALYSGYLQRQEADIAALRREERLALPAGLDYSAMPSLSAELRQKLTAVRPATLGQASRIDGMTPAALAVILGHVKRRDRQDVA